MNGRAIRDWRVMGFDEFDSAHASAGGRRANCKSVVVGITGGSGSGKTTFAERLCKRLGEDAVMISHDDYYKHLPHMTVEEAMRHDFDSPDAIDTGLLIEHLNTLVDGRPADIPSYNFATHARTEAARHVEPVPVILVEGMLLMCNPELLSLFDLIIFLDGEPDVRVLRRIVRDCQERGADLDRAVGMYLGTAKPAHEKYVEPFKGKADMIIPDATNDRVLEVVAQGICRMRNNPSE